MAERDAQERMTSYTSPFMPDFIFTPEDVLANREGKLTTSQEQIVKNAYEWRRQGRSKTLRFFTWWIPILLVGGLFVEAVQSAQPFGDFIADQFPTAVLVLVALLVLLSLFAVFDYWTMRHVRLRRISIAEGLAQTRESEITSRGYSYLQYELTLKSRLGKGKRFRFANASSLTHFEAGKRYRLYHIKFYPFPIVLSTEAV
jgi:hypothetical protein